MLGLRNRNKRVELFLLLVLPLAFSFCKNAAAGTGYIDASGKWHFAVAFYHSAGTPPSTAIKGEWEDILRLADEMLYKSTGGLHRLGNISFVSGPYYEPTVDVVVLLDSPVQDPFADIYGLRPGYHIFISELWRTGRGPDTVARHLLHELGHYLYSLFDEYRGTASDTPDKHCIYSSVHTDCYANNACFMESIHISNTTWCYAPNHERADLINPPLKSTWQSQANNGEGCWPTIERVHNVARVDICPASVASPPALPTPVQRSQRVELVVAIERSLCPSLADPNCNKIKQMLDQVFISERQGLPGAVVFLVFDKEQARASTPRTWSNALISDYETPLDSLLSLSLPSGGENLDKLLQNTVTHFNAISSATGSRNGASYRNLFLLMKGTESPIPLSLDSPILEIFLREGIHTTIGFMTPNANVDPAFIAFAEATGASWYDSKAPNVRHALSHEASNQQTVYTESRLVIPGQAAFFYYTPRDILKSPIVSISWDKPKCRVSASLSIEGVLQPPPLGQNDKTDLNGHAILGRRLARLEPNQQVCIRVDSLCAGAPVRVDFSISDAAPAAYLTVTSQRPTYGTADNIIVNFRALDPYPLRSLDSVFVGEIDSLGNFIKGMSEQAFDTGEEQIGDWYAGDGIYSATLKSVDRTKQLHTVRVIAINNGGVRYVSGEKIPDSTFFSATQSALAPVKFRREGYVTFCVDHQTPTSLPLRITSVSRFRNKDNVSVRGTFDLGPDYRHAKIITGTSSGGLSASSSLRINGNSFSDTIRVDTTQTTFKLSLSLRAFYRTGDIRTAEFSQTFSTAVEEQEYEYGGIPQSFKLYASYPNPFNLSTRIVFDVPQTAKVSLAIYDVSGRKIRTLLDRRAFQPGQHETLWQGDTDHGDIASTGVYFIRMTSGNFKQVQKITLIK